MQDIMNTLTENFSGSNTVWVLLGAILVFWMQAGFAMVETGFTRAKNAGNIIMKNLMDFCIGAPLYWLFGFGIMFGVSTGGIIGHYAGIASAENYSNIASAMAADGIPFWAYLAFQTMFCATTATIVSGAMAERTKFSAYCIYSAVISGIIYPIEAHWIWGGGWLSSIGFHDFAGSTCVHMTGGVAAIIGAAIVGPRIGKYTKDGKPRAIPGHSLTLGALGVFILYVGWFGFNPCSTLTIDTVESGTLASKVFITTNLAAACATCTTMFFTWVKYKKPDVSMTLNGTLAGLVAITAGCDAVNPIGAAIIGICAGFAVVLGIEFIDKVLKIDDPVGACGVHLVNGALGTLLTGLFADGSTTEKGLFYGGGLHLFGIQLLGVVCVAAYAAILLTILFEIIKHTIGLRATPEEERLGMDIAEHNLASAYADFVPATVPSINTKDYSKEYEKEGTPAPAEKAVPVLNKKSEKSDTKLSSVHIICRQSKFDVLKDALADIGVTGFSVTNILGCGTQKGAPEFYRGTAIEPELLPKIKVECVVSAVPVEKVIETARKALYTGHIGDGKIFVYDVEEIVRVRTGETGFDALQESSDENK